MRRIALLRLLLATAVSEADDERVVSEVARGIARRTMADAFPKLSDVSAELVELLWSADRKQAERMARAMTITDQHLAALVYNAAAFGYRHELVNRERRPEHLRLTDAEEHAFFFERKTDPELAAKAHRKIICTFRERRLTWGHLFWNADRWHAFTFSNDDAWLGKRGHWKQGPHLHYTSSLFEPRREARDVLAELNDPESRVHGEHVRFAVNRRRRP